MTARTVVLLALLATGLVDLLAGQRRPMPDERRRLGLLVGRFEGDVTFLPPDGSEGRTGRMLFQADWDLDSAWVAGRYEQRVGTVRLAGLLHYTWLAASRAYLYLGVPNSAMEPARMHGQFLADTLVFESLPGVAPAYRETWARHGADTLVTTLCFARDGACPLASRAVLVRTP